MSYYIYHTEGIVFKGYDVGESSKYLKILTKDLGLLGVRAQGLRELKSKLRYSLQDFSHTNINIVRGKNIWRIISASQKSSFDNLLIINTNNTSDYSNYRLKTFARITSFVRRLINGEEKNEEIFDFILNTLNFLKKENLNEKELENIELISKIKILFYLGYLDPKKNFLPFVKFSLWEKELVNNFYQFKEMAKEEIEASLAESHL